MSNEVLEKARRAYDIATRMYWIQRRNGGIVPLDPSIPKDSDDLAAGAKFKTTTPAAATALGVWQKCKAELDAAQWNQQRALGNEECPVCPKRELPPWPEQDRRLPPEKDDDVISSLAESKGF